MQVLCHRAATGLSIDNDASPCVHHAANGLAIAGAALIPAHLLGLVYDQRELEISQIKSACKCPRLSPSYYRSALVSAFFIQFCSASEFLILFERRCAGVCVCLCARVPVRVCAYRWVSNMQFACSLRLKVYYKFPTCLALGHDLSEVDLCVCFAAFSRLSYARHIY